MKQFFILAIVSFTTATATSQQFIDKAVIEYEVRTNVKKTMGNDSWDEMLKDQIPQFKTAYFQLIFNDNKSIYKFSRWADGPKVPEFLRRSDEENQWYFDFTTNKFNMKKDVFGNTFFVNDSIPTIEWKLTNESRVIAGFNCRKAVGKIMDSVYAFAFYTDEITIPAGPCSLSGLPGAILGLTIPRMYASYIATKVTLGADAAIIKPIDAKKQYTKDGLKATINERIKEWFSDDDDNEDSKTWRNQFYWNLLL
jgi:GLPGLI family protein